MQAHSQSTPAARIPTAVPTSSLPLSAPSLADTTGLAHDAGNLLAALTLYCDLLSVPGVLQPRHQHYATELRTISESSSRLIRRLIELPLLAASDPAGFATPPLPPALLHRRNARATDVLSTAPDHAADLASLLRSLAPVLQSIASGAGAVTISCPEVLPPLGFHPEIIERIVVNLVRNAAEAIRLQQSTTDPSTDATPGEIHVALTRLGARVHLTVQDNGPGMSPATVSEYLQPTPLPAGATRGLGHRIVHELVASSAGQLSIRVRPRHGTIFTIKWNVPETPSAEPCPSDTNITPLRTPE